MRRFLLARAAAAALPALGLALALGACADDPQLTLTTPPAAAPFMTRYVAIGNSITAGYQSDGINDSTQARSYAVLLARAAGVPFRVPALRKPGCAPPLVNFLTGQRVAPAAGQAVSPAGCYGRADTSYTNVLNNVAVPGANSYDPIGANVAGGTGTTAGGSNILTTLFLGGRTQAQRALDVDPTFATVWIGNNDVLSFAISGTTTGVTDSAAFIANYNTLVTQLRSRNQDLRGVLIGIVDVTNTPVLVPLSVFNPNGGGTGFAAFQPAAFAGVQALFGVGTTRPATFQITFAASCTNSQAAISIPVLRNLNANIPANAPGYQFVCAAGATQTPGLLDDARRTFFVNRVTAWNRYISAKADSIGFAYYNPNTLLGQARASGQIPPFPNLANPTRPFGPLISNDGVHPGSPAHTLVARELIGVINAKYQSTLSAASVPDLAP
jgi:lysophospholipase L1-like esterase